MKPADEILRGIFARADPSVSEFGAAMPTRVIARSRKREREVTHALEALRTYVMARGPLRRSDRVAFDRALSGIADRLGVSAARRSRPGLVLRGGAKKRRRS
jgi:hypothetical protein